MKIPLPFDKLFPKISPKKVIGIALRQLFLPSPARMSSLIGGETAHRAISIFFNNESNHTPVCNLSCCHLLQSYVSFIRKSQASWETPMCILAPFQNSKSTHFVAILLGVVSFGKMYPVSLTVESVRFLGFKWLISTLANGLSTV